MRLGYVVAGGVDRPGGTRDVPHLVERLAWLARSHDVGVVALRQEGRPAAWRRAGVEVVNVGRRPRRVRAAAALHGMHRARPFDVLHAFGLVPQGVVASGVGRILGVPVVFEAPGGEFADEADLDFGGWRRWQGRAWIRSAVRGGEVVVNSRFAHAAAARRGVEATVVPLGLDETDWPARTPSRRGAGPFRLAWVGSLNAVKQPHLALDTLAALGSRDVTLDVVGEEFDRGAARAHAGALGVGGRVRFHGRVPPSHVRALLAGSHALLLTSRFEAAGRVVLEAASQGVPTVGRPVGYVADWSGDAAWAAEAGAGAEGLAQGVATLAADEDRRLRLAARAAARLTEHRRDAVGARWIALYARVAAAAPAHPGAAP